MDRLKTQIVRLALGVALILLFVGHAAHFFPIPLVSVIDAFIYDARLRLTMPRGIDDRVIIVDIDEKSLAEIGRWPWGRDRLAALMDRLFDRHGVAALGFDVVFAEADTSSGIATLDAIAQKELKDNAEFQGVLKRLRPSLDHDRRFADALARRNVILGYYFANAPVPRTAGVLPAPVLPAGTFKGRSLSIAGWNSFGSNLPELQARAAGAGHFVPLVDFDGVSRRVPMLVEYQGAFYESLSLALVRSLLGNPRVVPGYATDSFGAGRDYAGLEWLDLPTARGVVRIPVDESAATLIPYRGPAGSFPYISAADILLDRLPDGVLRDRVALVGTTAPGLMDLRSTPVSAVYPGVEIHANLVAAILAGQLKSKPAYMLGAEVVLLCFTGLLLTLLLPLLSPLRATLLTAGLLLVTALIDLWLWQRQLVLPLAGTLLLCIGLYTLNMAWGYFVESRSKKQFAELFGQYVPPELVDEMARDPERYTMEGRSEELTVLFSDVRNFTTISEGMEPRDLAHMMNEYLGAMTEVIQAHRGTLDKYIGDAIVAFWGAPVADPGHARHALEAALEMRARLAALAQPFRERGWPVLRFGVGLNTGVMTVGDMGSPVRKAYTVIGDAANLGSRLEGLTRKYGVDIVVGEQTRAAIGDHSFRELDRVRVKGKQAPVAIYEPLGPTDGLSRDVHEELKLWQQALRLYRAREWDQCDVQLYNLRRLAPDRTLYQLYASRVEHYRQEPPVDGWDGVTTFDTK